MPSITFTDTVGAAKLHNGKPHPAGRFANWTPDSTPFGEAASRQSDGATTMFRLRSDYAVAFELPRIPSRRSSNLVLQSENFGTTWTAVGTPTRSAAAHVASGITLDLIGDDDAGAEEGYKQTIAFTTSATKGVSVFVKNGTAPAASGFRVKLRDSSAGADRLNAVVTFDAGGNPSVVAGTGTFLGYELQADGVYRLLFRSAAITHTNTNELSISPAATTAETGNLYTGGFQAEDNTSPTDYLYTTTATAVNVALSDIADRLRFHLRNGGTCAVQTSDAAASAYATCSIAPGAVPQLTLTDKRALEYTLALPLLNTAGSPVQMVCRYADQ